MNQTQPSLNADDDRDSKATEALEAARLMPAGKEKSEALKRAGLLRKAADIHKPFPAKKRGRPPVCEGNFFDRPLEERRAELEHRLAQDLAARKTKGK